MQRCAYLVGPVVFLALLAPLHSQQSSASWTDGSKHTTRFVTVDKDVRLEVLDWGGSGRPLVLLAGGGNTAHVFDDFAPKLTSDHHVYAITRRGFGASGFAPSADPRRSLYEDVLTVIGTLKLEKPVLVGHSIAGAEMTAVATTYPDRVAGLIYLEAGYPYAFDNGQGPGMEAFQASGPRPPNRTDADLASFTSLQNWDAEVYGFRIPESEFRQLWEADSSGRPRRPRAFPGSQAFTAIMSNTKAYTHIPKPALVIFASPHVQENWAVKSTNPRIRDEAKTYYAALDAATEKQAKALEAGVRTAHVVRLPGAHYIFLSNEQDTLREMRAFLVSLK